VSRLTGLEHENLLQQKLLELEVPFMSEEDLRNVGYPKTPDVKLLLPFGIISLSNSFVSRVLVHNDNKKKKKKKKPQLIK
jgi:hypothetical protein